MILFVFLHPSSSNAYPNILFLFLFLVTAMCHFQVVSVIIIGLKKKIYITRLIDILPDGLIY